MFCHEGNVAHAPIVRLAWQVIARIGLGAGSIEPGRHCYERAGHGFRAMR